MALEVRIVTTFPRSETTPASILWEGVVEVQNPDKIVPEGQPGGGYPERIIKGQMKLVTGRNGTFIGTPSRKTADGRYFNYYDLGPSLQKLIVPALEAAAAVDPAPVAAAAPTAEAVAETAADDFSDLAF